MQSPRLRAINCIDKTGPELRENIPFLSGLSVSCPQCKEISVLLAGWGGVTPTQSLENKAFSVISDVEMSVLIFSPGDLWVVTLTRQDTRSH